MDYFDIGTRVWTDYPRNRKPDAQVQRAAHAVVFDTETLAGPGQELMFLTYTYLHLTYQPDSVSGHSLLAGIAYPDDLPVTDPDGYRTLAEYVRDHRPEFIDLTYTGAAPSPRFEFIPVSEFIRKWIIGTCFAECKPLGPAMLVSFNSPFDLATIAIDAGAARSQRRRSRDGATGRRRPSRFFGGFSLSLQRTANHGEGRNPRLRIKNIDSKRSLMGFGSVRFTEPGSAKSYSRTFPGYILDLRTLTYALKDKSYSLRGAAEAFGLPVTKSEAEGFGIINTDFIDYAVRDTEVTTLLLVAALSELQRHNLDVEPWRLYSPAGLAKAYLAQLGITPILNRGPVDHILMGRAMAAYVGGRAEARITRTPVPVAVYDFTSMYPTVNALLGLWQGHIHKRIDQVDVTAEIHQLVEHFDVDQVFNKTLWARAAVLVKIVPNGAVLPVRAAYGTDSTYNVGVNHLADTEPAWVALPDVLAACLLSESRPVVIAAIRLVPARGLLPDLTPVKLRGVVDVDPAQHDFYVTLVEQRQPLKDSDPETATALKCIANSGSYGVLAQFNVVDLPAGDCEQVTAYSGDEVFTAKVAKPEQPGEYCYPPYAALITAGARLMLAAAERLVADAGGGYAFMDTDSIAILASPTGGPIPGVSGPRALTYEEANLIAARFNTLNPYDQSLVPNLLKCESGEDEISYVISAKRYVRYRTSPDGPIELIEASIPEPDGPETLEIVKATEHGLGYLLAPLSRHAGESAAEFATRRKAWPQEAWRHVLAQALGHPSPTVDWLDCPTPIAMTVSSPHLLNRFDEYNKSCPPGQQIRAFGFILVITGRTSRGPVTLLAPRVDDPHAWSQMDWYPLTGPLIPHRIETGPEVIRTGPDVGLTADGRVRTVVRSYRQVLDEFAHHPEAKSQDSRGRADRRSTGLLKRRTVAPATRSLIGKEAHRIEEQAAGLTTTGDGIATIYRRRDTQPALDIARQVLTQYATDELIDQIPTQGQLSRRQLRLFLSGKTRRPKPETTAVLLFIAATLAAEALGDPRLAELASYRPEAVLQAWKQRPALPERHCICGCGHPPATARSKYATPACRVRNHRQKAKELQQRQHKSAPSG